MKFKLNPFLIIVLTLSNQKKNFIIKYDDKYLLYLTFNKALFAVETKI